LAVLEQRRVALVGARKSTKSGRAIARSVAAGLVAHGCTVVSGLAVGIDAAAHRGTSTAPGERAIADLSSPLDEASVQILDAIAAKPRQLDEIAVLIDRDPQRVSQCLMQLQLSGFVRRGPDGYIRLL